MANNPEDNVYARLGARPVINAGGNTTVWGGSTHAGGHAGYAGGQ
jgi:hypothetical protein